MLEIRAKIEKTQDELDLAAYKLQEQQKDVTEMRLKTDVLTSVNDGLMSDKSHLTSELKEVRELQRTYEAKCSELMAELTETTSKLKDQERDMIGHNEVTREREERITK